MWPFRKDDREDVLRAEYAVEKQRMLAPRVVERRKDFNLVEVVCEIMQNEADRMGVLIAVNWKGGACAVHEMNLDVSFSRKLPYWTKQQWRRFQPRRFALCLMITDNHGDGKPSIHRIAAVGQKVIEMDTSLLPLMEFNDWRHYLSKK